MPEIPFNVVMALVTLVGSGGVAWGAVKMALNGTRTTVAEIRRTLDAHVTADHDIQLKAVAISTRIETKLDAVIARLENDG